MSRMLPVGSISSSKTYLKAQNSEKMRSPGKIDPDPCDLLPRRAVFGHAISSNPHETFDAILQCRRGAGYWPRVWQLTIIHPAKTQVQGTAPCDNKWCLRFVWEENDQTDNHRTIDRTNAIRPAPTFGIYISTLPGREPIKCACLALATKKPNAKGERKGEMMNPIVQIFS